MLPPVLPPVLPFFSKLSMVEPSLLSAQPAVAKSVVGGVASGSLPPLPGSLGVLLASFGFPGWPTLAPLEVPSWVLLLPSNAADLQLPSNTAISTPNTGDAALNAMRNPVRRRIGESS